MSWRHAASEHVHTRRRARAPSCAITISGPMPTPCDGWILAVPARLARNARTYQITLANGSTQTFRTSDPGRLLLTGQLADLGVMDNTNFVESAGLPPTSTTTLRRRSKRCSTTTGLFGRVGRQILRPTCRRFFPRTGWSSIADSLERKNGRRCWRTSESCRTVENRMRRRFPASCLFVNVWTPEWPSRSRKPGAAC